MPGSQKARDDWVSKAYGEGSGSQRIGDVWVSRVREVWVSKDWGAVYDLSKHIN